MTCAPPSHIMSRLEALYNKRVVFVNRDRAIPMTTKSYYAFGEEHYRDKGLLILKEQRISIFKPSETDIEFIVITAP